MLVAVQSVYREIYACTYGACSVDASDLCLDGLSLGYITSLLL